MIALWAFIGGTWLGLVLGSIIEGRMNRGRVAAAYARGKAAR